MDAVLRSFLPDLHVLAPYLFVLENGRLFLGRYAYGTWRVWKEDDCARMFSIL